MQTVTAINENKDDGVHIFLAGGISGCANWQSELIKLLDGYDDIILHNPRRDNFPIDNPNASYEQIKWEYEHLRQCDIISFWFCEETMNPIVLFELGAWSMTDKPIVVGIHPNYQRRQDVEIQMSLIKPDMSIHYSLDTVRWAILSQCIALNIQRRK